MNPASKLAPKRNKRKIVGIILAFGPTLLIIASLLLYATANFFTTSNSSSSDLFGETSLLQSIVNICLFLMGVTGVISWLPGLIVGIVLLTTKKK